MQSRIWLSSVGVAEQMLTEEEKADFCNTMLKRYRVKIDIDNEMLPIFLVAYQSALISEDTSLKTSQQLQKVMADFQKNAVEKVSKMETKQFRFQTPKEAFWFGFGQQGLSIVVIASLISCGWLFRQYQAKAAREESRASFLFEKSYIQERQINDSVKAHLITLYPVRDLQKAKAGMHYVYGKDCKCIDIPLFYERIK